MIPILELIEPVSKDDRYIRPKIITAALQTPEGELWG